MDITLHIELVPLPQGTFSLVIELVIDGMVYIFTGIRAYELLRKYCFFFASL